MLRRSATNAGADAPIRLTTASARRRRFEKGLAQVNQVAFRTAARTRAAVGRRDTRRAERIGAGDDHVVRDDVAVLEREDIERAQKLLELEEQRHGERSPPPPGGVRQALGEIVERKPIDERQRMQRAAARPACPGRRRPPIAAGRRIPVRDRRPAPRARCVPHESATQSRHADDYVTVASFQVPVSSSGFQCQFPTSISLNWEHWKLGTGNWQLTVSQS